MLNLDNLNPDITFSHFLAFMIVLANPTVCSYIRFLKAETLKKHINFNQCRINRCFATESNVPLSPTLSEKFNISSEVCRYLMI